MQDSTRYGLILAGVVLGLAVLVIGEAVDGLEPLIAVGGVVLLAAVGAMTAHIAGLEEPDHESEPDHGAETESVARE